MYSLNVRKQAGRFALLPLLMLSSVWPSYADGSTGQCEANCRPQCADEFPQTPGCRTCATQLQACIARCVKQCQPRPPVLINPKYLVLTLLYAPPGCTGSSVDRCPVQGSVAYGATSSTGTKISTTSSFQESDKVTVGIKDVFSASAGFQITASDGTSETVTKTQALTLGTQATKDGVDHDLDEFVLLTDPVVSIQQTSAAALWSLALAGGSFNTTNLTVGELKNPSSMPPDVARHLAALGFTNSDFQTILSLDPFAFGATSVDPLRYTDTGLQLGYEPPPANTCTNGLCPCVTAQYPISNTLLNAVNQSFSTQYSVGLSGGALGTKGLGLVSDSSFTWTNTAASENSQQGSQTATLALACPSPNYNGPVSMSVYWDGIYGSFLFVPVPDSVVVQQGTVTSAAGAAMRGVPVTLAFGGKTYRTFTDYRGHYGFLLPSSATKSLPATGVVSVKSVQQTAPLHSATATRIRVP